MDAFQPEKRKELIEGLKKELDDGKIKVLVHSVAKGNLKPMVSNSVQVLQTDDFQLTIQAMGISLYDWVKAVFVSKTIFK